MSKSKEMILRILKKIGWIILFFLGLIILYLVVAIGLSIIPVNENPIGDNDVEIFLRSNGVHTDLILPVKYDSIDWSREVEFSNTVGKDTNMTYVAFGWGDKGFYINTPTWSDLKFSVAFNAMFGLSSSAMHVTFYKSVSLSERTKKLYLSKLQYYNLAGYIRKSFQKDVNGKYICIKTNNTYGKNDAFYEANGSYSLFRTCNSWTNEALKVSGQRACLWTPFDKGIFFHYKDL